MTDATDLRRRTFRRIDGYLPRRSQSPPAIGICQGTTAAGQPHRGPSLPVAADTWDGLWQDSQIWDSKSHLET